jgi:cysteine-rich repeat protein
MRSACSLATALLVVACAAACVATEQAAQCANEADDDGDGLVDCEDPNCALSGECARDVDDGDDGCQLEPCGPQPAGCGDLVVDFERGEECDDGNGRDGDGCSRRCRFEFCGDGIVTTVFGEQCEAPDPEEGLLCVFCRFTRCGNGELDGFEQCDDGNAIDGDGCSQSCFDERCGDFIVQFQAGEQCDDGNQLSGDGCSPECVTEFCGDGALQPRLGELCDDGAASACTSDCRAGPVCAGDPALCFDGSTIVQDSFSSRALVFDDGADGDDDFVLYGFSSQPRFVDLDGATLTTVLIDPNSWIESLAALDADADGDVDLVGVDGNWNRVAFERNGTTWTRRDLGFAGDVSRESVALDFDGDGALDVASFGITTGVVEMCLRGAAFTFSCSTLATFASNQFLRFAAVDLEGDGVDELVAADGSEVVVYGTVDGEAVERTRETSDFVPTRRADVDLDGDEDLVGFDVANGDVVVHGNEAGVLAESARIPAGLALFANVTADDLDGDGDVDLIAVSRARGELWVFLAEAGGRRAVGPLPGGARPATVSTLDLDGDGVRELLTVGENGNGLVRLELVP